MPGVLENRTPDILIAGAGPAGLATALFLAKQGIASTLVDKEVFPRDKICGDGLSGWVVSMLRRLDPELLARLQTMPNQLPSHGIRFYAPNMRSVALPYSDARYPGEPPGHVMRRIDFDRLLMEAAQKNPLIDVIQGITLANTKIEADGIILTDITGKHRFQAKLCVLATGATSKLVRSVFPDKHYPRHQATGIRQYYNGVTGFHEGNYVDFFFLGDFLPGYLWIFPLPDGRANVGAGIRTDLIKKRRISLKLVMEQALIHNPILAERFRNAVPVTGVSARELPLGSERVPLSGNRILLTGDAGSLVDPFTGEGVGNALWSGYAAAEHISKAMKVNRFDARFNKQYDRFVYRKLGKELRLSTLMQRLIRYPWIINGVMNRISGDPGLEQSLIRMIDDLGERRKLARPGFYIRLLKKPPTQKPNVSHE